MEETKGKGKKGNLITKTWERCKTLGRPRKDYYSSPPLARKSKSWPRMTESSPERPDEGGKQRKRRVAPEGCFSVYVGPEMQRFVIKTEYANHPLFQMLLKEAESEYGFNCDGPLTLPCNVDMFCKVLMAIDDGDGEIRPGCGFVAKGSGGYRLLSPPRMIAINQF